jgi:hypothetical protein
MPSSVPSTKLISVAVPTRPTVQYRPVPITVVTWAGKLLVEMPRLPCSRLPQYLMYWSHADPLPDSPYSCSIPLIVAGVT